VCKENAVSTLATIYYEDTGSYYIHVAHETQEEAITIEVGDLADPAAWIAMPYEKALEMANEILSFANWKELINRRNTRRTL